VVHNQILDRRIVKDLIRIWDKTGASVIMRRGDAHSLMEARPMTSIRLGDLIPLRELRDDLPRPNQGKPYDPSTLARWCLYGLRGHKLESCKIAGRRYSTREALRRFLEAAAG
jgi:hypothetical protein